MLSAEGKRRKLLVLGHKWVSGQTVPSHPELPADGDTGEVSGSSCCPVTSYL